jgi:CRP/FNR family transcriptional regulator
LLDFPPSLEAYPDIAFEEIYVKAKTQLFHDPSFPTMYAVRSGVLKCEVDDPLDFSYITRFPRAGTLFGTEIIDSGVAATRTTTLSDAILIVLPRCDVVELMNRCDQFRTGIYTTLAKEMNIAHARIHSHAYRAPARVAAFLTSELARTKLTMRPNTFVLDTSLSDLATFIGVTLETLSRILREFQDGGLICREQRMVTVLNPQKLRKLVHRKCDTSV